MNNIGERNPALRIQKSKMFVFDILCREDLKTLPPKVFGSDFSTLVNPWASYTARLDIAETGQTWQSEWEA